MVCFEGGTFEVDAATIASGLGIDASSLLQRMREGTLTSRCERGIDSDEGRYRLTFSTAQRRLRLVVDEAGNLLQRSTINFGERPPVRAAVAGIHEMSLARDLRAQHAGSADAPKWRR